MLETYSKSLGSFQERLRQGLSLRCICKMKDQDTLHGASQVQEGDTGTQNDLELATLTLHCCLRRPMIFQTARVNVNFGVLGTVIF